MDKYRQRIEEIAKRICAEIHVALYDIEELNTNKGKVITVYLTKVGGISLSECAIFSRKLSVELDAQDFITEKYFLEVSSPGVERALKLKMHYASAINETVDIQWQQDEQRQSCRGVLLEVNPETIVVRCSEHNLTIPFSAIHKAKTILIKQTKKESR